LELQSDNKVEEKKIKMEKEEEENKILEIEAEDEVGEEEKNEDVEEIRVGAIKSNLFIGDEGQINFRIAYFAFLISQLC
jgi:hypothetical protein